MLLSLGGLDSPPNPIPDTADAVGSRGPHPSARWPTRMTHPPDFPALPGGIAILSLSARTRGLAARLCAALPDATLLDGTEGSGTIADRLRAAFAAGRPIIGLCAAGILIRTLAPLLADKRDEPPVLAVAEDGSAVVPLLGGHHGANRLARRVAAMLGGRAAITTASDLAFDLALDDPPPGWILANPEDVKAFTATLLAGAPVRLDGPPTPWLAAGKLPWGDPALLTLQVTERNVAGAPDRLVFHPATLALGVGCERGAEPDELATLVDATLAEAGSAKGAVALVASITLKADEPAVHATAARLGVPARFFPPDRLEAETPRLTQPSAAVFQAVGCHGVAEAAALAAAGPDGRLLVPKRKSARATCALAQATAPIVPARTGRPRGLLAVIGTGPGTPAWRPPETDALLRRATDLVGYSLYIDLLEPLPCTVTRHHFALGDEQARARFALDLAAQGRSVALVSSGDPGIYAMAAVLFEVLDTERREAWARLDIVVSPGISALQAAAARTGAPLGHDFCAISLSDLLTPWPVIERRLRAAAEADFVVALYNPVSQKRTTQIGLARDILLAHRAPETPVVLARNLGRPEERVEIIDLAALSAQAVDMLTLVLVGNSQTRRLVDSTDATLGRRPWLLTPRGYAEKLRR